MTTTKDHCLFFKDKQNLVVKDNLNDQFINLNLNQNKQRFAEIIHSTNVENNSKALSNYDFSHNNDLQTRQKPSPFGKTKLAPSLANLNAQNNYGKKEEQRKISNANSSTLSLHITAYENSIEATSGNTMNGEKDESNKKKGNTSSIKNWKAVKEIFNGSNVKYAFELPRQQKAQNNDPEVMRFKASQRLSNVNRASSSSNAEHANVMQQNIIVDIKSMAQKFRSFLENASELYKPFLDESLLIVSIIGKDSKTWKKSDIINNLCETQACIGQIDSENPEIFIEAYLSTEDSTLFFVLHGVHDFDVQTKLFASDEYKNKSFFEKLAQAEYDELSLMHLIFLLSHLVVVVEQGRYFDTTYMKTFADINQMRLAAKDELVDELLRNPQLPKMWSDYGRLSCPRICFLFPDRCIRHELPLNKKKEIAEKLELGWEQQIFNNLKHIRIVDTSLINCLVVLPEDVRYVHVVKSPSEEPRDLIVDLLSKFLDNTNPSTHINDDDIHSYCTFLRSAMENILRYGDRFKNFNCFPTLKEFIIGAQITYNTLIKDATAIKLEEFVPELAIAQSIETSHWERAIHNYRTNCISNGGCFSKSEHLNELDKAINSVKAMVSAGENLKEALIKVTETCTEYWENGHQRCESVSVTGHFCKHKIHEKDIEHDSGYRFTSSCNCGKKQITRMDPFTLKEANYDFFLQFQCCSNMDSFKFPLFIPTASTEPTESVSPDDSERLDSPIVTRPNLHRRAKSTASESSKITDTAALSGETLDDEEMEDEEVDTVFDRYLDDDKLKELFLDEKDKKKIKHRGTSLMDDEELDEEEEDDEEEEEPADEEVEENVEGIGSYLDNYDENLRLDKPKAVSYEKLLKCYKGQFIEYLLHSNSPPGLLPGFPSWSLKVIGPSNRYSHQHGLRLPNFKHGCDFLLPLDVYLRVNSKDWENDLKKLNPRIDLSARSRRKPLGVDEEEGMNTEKVKFFIGFDYECPRGHRFFIEQPNKSVKAEKRLGPFAYKDEARDLLDSDVPIWMPCTCRRNPLVPAQLMRLHIVTPKAPISAKLDIRVQPSSVNQNGYFYPHSEPLELAYNKYYILRLPFAYEGPDGPTHPPRAAKSCGRLLKNWFTASHHRI